MDTPPTITALLKAPTVSLDEIPGNIKNAAKIMAINESAFIGKIKYLKKRYNRKTIFVVLLNCKNSRRSRRNRIFDNALLQFYIRNFS